MKKLSFQEIQEMSARDLVDRLRSRQFSLLQSLGFHKLRAEMYATGLVCRALVKVTGLAAAVRRTGGNLSLNDSSLRKVSKVLNWAAPSTIVSDFPTMDSLVIGFNHPSLGEILRFIYICMTIYRHKHNLFPVNLPWYEALMPVAHELEAAGIYIMPVITPSTRQKMAKSADSETMRLIGSLSESLNMLYLNKCADFIKEGENVWVAPSATRQHYVFKTKECYEGTEKILPQTITLLTIALMRDKVEHCSFLAVGVNPPEGFKRGLNLFRVYEISAGPMIDFEEAKSEAKLRCKNNDGRQLEQNFLLRIAMACRRAGSSRLICPES